MKNKFKPILLIIIFCLSCSTNGVSKEKTKGTIPTYKPFYAENGSYKGQYSLKTNRPKNVYVNGYKKRNSSYTRSHYKSKKR